MAKSKVTISLNYKNAKKKAEELEKIATDINKKKEKLSECRKILESHWKGDNGNAYRKKMVEKEDELSSIVTNLQNIASTIKIVAKNSYNADMQAVELAQKKKK